MSSDKANLLNTMGKGKEGCQDCGVPAFAGGHSDFSSVGNDKHNLGAGWTEKKLHRTIYQALDPAKDPCECD